MLALGGSSEHAESDIATWHDAKLNKPVNKGAWQQWEADLDLPMAGYYEIWAKATDSEGDSQPVVQPQWNPKVICLMAVIVLRQECRNEVYCPDAYS